MNETVSFYDEHRSISLYCQRCKSSPTLLNGSGRPIPLAILIDNSPPRVKQALSKVVKEHTINSVHHHNEILACPSCNTLTSKFIIQLFDDQAKRVYESKFYCSKCSTALIPATQLPENYCCAKCGQRSLRPRYDEMLWD